MVTLTEKARDYLKSVGNGDYVSLGVKVGAVLVCSMYGIMQKTGQM